jgi:hypothetical protein
VANVERATKDHLVATGGWEINQIVCRDMANNCSLTSRAGSCGRGITCGRRDDELSILSGSLPRYLTSEPWSKAQNWGDEWAIRTDHRNAPDADVVGAANFSPSTQEPFEGARDFLAVDD